MQDTTCLNLCWHHSIKEVIYYRPISIIYSSISILIIFYLHLNLASDPITPQLMPFPKFKNDTYGEITTSLTKSFDVVDRHCSWTDFMASASLKMQSCVLSHIYITENSVLSGWWFNTWVCLQVQHWNHFFFSIDVFFFIIN